MQMQPSGLGRANISDDVAAAVRAMIVDGRLAAGARINEVHLAAALGVSRTPLREALNRLAAEGAVESVPRRGVFVAPLSVEELDQLYTIRPLLDPEALRLAGVPAAADLDRLDALNARIERERDPERLIDLDDAWHLLLLKACPNRVLVGLIEQIMRRTRRYELAFMRDRRNVDNAAQHHRHIVDALRRGDLATACAELLANMQHGHAPIVAWLRERTENS